ncbi:MAG: recombinase family protein [Acidobacteriota bacterium]|nr:recombinase family protein [Acidobacteriota bacterium]
MQYKRYFSYVRVSTVRQGQTGTSLTEQKAAIERYSRQWSLKIIKCFEERETAAKQGRPVFLEMLKLLKNGKASGVVIHKIDRSARNLKDWADLGSLIDSGIEVHFANETLDLNSRGGRLSADIQAVVASDYIRNLREETKKGIYGRLKQGLYPMPAPIGYLNAGKGKPKELDMVQAPLIRQAFELYASGEIGLNPLVDKMYAFGLRNKNGGKVTRNGLASILHNPFYTGLIELKTTGELFVGQHPPIITRALFDEAQAVFEGKNNKKTKRHFFIFRRFVRCSFCERTLIPERQKGWAYYRCQTKNCQQKTLREELIECALLETLKKVEFTDEEKEYLWAEILELDREKTTSIEANYKQLSIREETIKNRLSKLADAFVDEVFDKETYLEKKNQLVIEEQEIKEKLNRLSKNETNVLKQLKDFLELLNRAYLSYKFGKPEEKREMVETCVSNFAAKEKSLVTKLKMPFQIVSEYKLIPSGSPSRATTRTLSAQLSQVAKNLYEFFSEREFTDDDNLEHK